MMQLKRGILQNACNLEINQNALRAIAVTVAKTRPVQMVGRKCTPSLAGEAGAEFGGDGGEGGDGEGEEEEEGELEGEGGEAEGVGAEALRGEDTGGVVGGVAGAVVGGVEGVATGGGDATGGVAIGVAVGGGVVTGEAAGGVIVTGASVGGFPAPETGAGTGWLCATATTMQRTATDHAQPLIKAITPSIASCNTPSSKQASLPHPWILQ